MFWQPDRIPPAGWQAFLWSLIYWDSLIVRWLGCAFSLLSQWYLYLGSISTALSLSFREFAYAYHILILTTHPFCPGGIIFRHVLCLLNTSFAVGYVSIVDSFASCPTVRPHLSLCAWKHEAGDEDFLRYREFFHCCSVRLNVLWSLKSRRLTRQLVVSSRYHIIATIWRSCILWCAPYELVVQFLYCPFLP